MAKKVININQVRKAIHQDGDFDIEEQMEQVESEIEILEEIDDSQGYYVPNAFSPNMDGINDVLSAPYPPADIVSSYPSGRIPRAFSSALYVPPPWKVGPAIPGPPPLRISTLAGTQSPPASL